MKFRNDYDLPLVIKRALENTQYEGPALSEWPKKISTTTLINPPQIAALKKVYDDQIERDISEMTWALMGQAAHHVLQLGKGERGFAELRFISHVGNVEISSQIDYYEDGTLWDWKTTGVKSHGRHKQEWENQLNVEAWNLRQHGIDVEKVKNIVFYRDFFITKKPGGAKTSIVEIDQKLWSSEQAQIYVEERVIAHLSYGTRGDEDLCTNSDTWDGRRCGNFCDVARFCKQFAGTK